MGKYAKKEYHKYYTCKKYKQSRFDNIREITYKKEKEKKYKVLTLGDFIINDSK